MITKTATVTMYDGTKKRLYARAETEKDAARILANKLAEFENGRLVVGRGSTFGAWADEWLKVYCKPNKSSSDYKQFESIVRLHLKPRLGAIPLTALRPFAIQQCLNDMADMSSSQIAKTRLVLGSIIKTAKMNKLMPSDDTLSGVDWPRGRAGERRALTPDERLILMKCIPCHHRGVLFGFIYGCGLRPSEARALMWSDIDNGIVHVNKAIKKDTGEIGKPKSETGTRNVPIPPWLQDLVATIPKTSLFLFPNEKGRYISEDKMKDSWRSLKNLLYEKSGVHRYRNQLIEEEKRACSFYDVKMYHLRHTYCTILAENNVPIKTAQYLMGHSDISITARVYTHVTDTMVLQARDKIAQIDFTNHAPVTQTVTKEVEGQL